METLDYIGRASRAGRHRHARYSVGVSPAPDPAAAPEPPRFRASRGFVVLLAALGSIGPFAIDTYLPSLPAIGRDLAASPVQVQQTLSAYLFAFAMAILWHGSVSDALGRRRVLLFSYAVFAGASVGAALAGSIEALWFWRAVQGLVGGAGLAISRAVIRDLAHGADAHRLMAQSTMVFALAPAIAPMIGGLLQDWLGWRAVFWFLVLMASALWLAVLLLLPETLPPERRQSLRPASLARGYVSVFRQAQFWRLSLAMGTSFQGFFLYVMAAPAFLITLLGLAPTQFYWLFLPFTIGTMGGALLASRLADRFAPDVSIRLGQVLMAGAVAANLLVSWLLPGALPWAALPLCVYTFGLAIATPPLQVMLSDLSPERRGMVSSCHGFVQSLANSLAAALLVPLLWGSLISLALGSAALMGVGAVLLVAQRRFRPQPAGR